MISYFEAWRKADRPYSIEYLVYIWSVVYRAILQDTVQC